MAAKASPKKPTLEEALSVLEALFPPIALAERVEDPLIDHLMVAVLGWHLGEAQARACVRAISRVFIDMNEARGSPLQELETVVKPFVPEGKDVRVVCWDLRMALQDVWDAAHGLDLEPLRGREPEDQRNFVRDLPNTLGGPAALVFQIAIGTGRLAFGPRERHLLSRLGMLPRASTPQRVRQIVERKIPAEARYRFAWVAGASAHLHEETWDPSHPLCDLLVRLKAKEVADRERAKKKEEARRVIEARRQKKEEERRKKQEARDKVKREREEARRKVVEARKAAAEAKRKAAQEKKAAIEKKRHDAKKAAEAKKAAAEAKRKAQAEKKAAAQKKKAQAAKKAAKKKSPPARKPAPKKSSSPKRTSTASKAAKKRPLPRKK